MKALICPRCGEPLSKQKDGDYRCAYCGAIYSKEESQETEEIVRSILEEAKIEDLANRRRVLWDAAHQANISSKRLARAAHDVLALFAEDPLARFYIAALSKDPAELNSLLLSEPFGLYQAREVLRFCLLSLEPRNILALREFVERSFVDKEAEKYLNTLSDEAKKLDEGVYLTSLPRDVFLAYSSMDMDQVVEVADYLEANGLRVFVAARNLRHGKGAQENYEKALFDAMAHCRCIVYLSSEYSRNLQCDALKVELPFARDNLPDVGRIEYLIAPYGSKTPLAAKVMLKSVFKGKEWCTDREDLLERILSYVASGEKICHHCHEVNPSSATHCHKCGYPLDKGEYEKRVLEEKKLQEERKAWEKEKARLLKETEQKEKELRQKEEERRQEEETKRKEAERRAKEKELELEKQRLALEKEKLELERLRSSTTQNVDGEALLAAMEAAKKKRDEEKAEAERKAAEERRKEEEERKRKEEEEKRLLEAKAQEEFVPSFNRMIAKATPKLEADGVTLSFGMYPQSKVEDESLLAILNGLTKCYHPAFKDERIVTYDNKFYLVSTHDKGGKSEDSYFLFEPIRWKVLDQYETGESLALSEKGLRRLPMQEKAPDRSSLHGVADMLARYSGSSLSSHRGNFFDYDLGRWIRKVFIEQAFGENAKLLASVRCLGESQFFHASYRSAIEDFTETDYAIDGGPGLASRDYWLDGSYSNKSGMPYVDEFGRFRTTESLDLPKGVRLTIALKLPKK